MLHINAMIKIAVFLLLFINQAFSKVTCDKVIQNSSQLLLVLADDYNSTTANLERYEKRKELWHKAGKSLQVYVGRNGMAPAKGLCKIAHKKLNEKQEGDGKSPSGIFNLTSSFGKNLDVNFKTDYFQVKKTLHCIDDVNSKFYNMIIEESKGYGSHEVMLRDDGLYDLGAVVEYNTDPTVPKAGSCIFLHISANRPTAGCTSIEKENLEELLQWLDKKKNPILIQMPISTYRGLSIGSLIK